MRGLYQGSAQGDRACDVQFDARLHPKRGMYARCRIGRGDRGDGSSLGLDDWGDWGDGEPAGDGEAPLPCGEADDREGGDDADDTCGEDGRACADEAPFREGDEIISDPKLLGKLGEEIAARYVRACGWNVLERNYRCPYGEADLVYEDGDEVVLAEVKTRRGAEVFPEEMVDDRKIDKYRSICLHYLIKHKGLSHVRFDVIALNVPAPGVSRLHHVFGVSEWEG